MERDDTATSRRCGSEANRRLEQARLRQRIVRLAPGIADLELGQQPPEPELLGPCTAQRLQPSRLDLPHERPKRLQQPRVRQFRAAHVDTATGQDPWPRAIRSNSATKGVFPTPASPPIHTAAASPASPRSSAATKASSYSDRPTNAGLDTRHPGRHILT
jgi:hypothetical protein